MPFFLGRVLVLKTKWYSNLPYIIIGLCLVLSISVTVLGQSSSQTTTSSAARPFINYEVQQHVLLAANESSEKGSLPQSLDSNVIGTLNTNRPDEMLVLVVSVKRIP